MLNVWAMLYGNSLVFYDDPAGGDYQPDVDWQMSRGYKSNTEVPW